MTHAFQAEVAELADAPDSGSGARKGVGVRVPASAPILIYPREVSNFSCFPFGRRDREGDNRHGEADDVVTTSAVRSVPSALGDPATPAWFLQRPDDPHEGTRHR